MQVKCQKEDCFEYLEYLIKVPKKIELIGELGFTHKVESYKCHKCNSIYIKCPECEGEGFAETIHGYFDCDNCNGSGLIKIK